MKFYGWVVLLLIFASNDAKSIQSTNVQGNSLQPSAQLASESKKPSVMTTLPPIALAALCTAAIMYPVDLARALKMASVTSKQQSTFQLLKSFKETHGFQGFFTQGLVPEVARAFWMRTLKFFLFPVMHEKISGKSPAQGTVSTKAVAGMLASIPECISIMPLEIAKVLLQLDKEKELGNNMFTAMKSAVNRCGPSALFTGYVGVQYRQASWTAGYFASIDVFRQIIKDVIEKTPISLEKISWFLPLMSGFLAGVFGAMFNTPGDVIRTNIQKSVLKAGSECALPAGIGILTAGPINFFTTGGSIVQQRGLGSLYAGFGFKAIHLGGSGALMAFFVVLFKKLLKVKYD